MLPHPINCTPPDTEVELSRLSEVLAKYGYERQALTIVCKPSDDTDGDLAILLTKVVEQIFCFTQYGKEDPCQATEQKMLLYGHRFKLNNGRYLFLVSHAMPIYPFSASAVHIQMNGPGSDNLLMQERMRAVQAQYAAAERKMLSVDPGLEFEEHSEEIGNLHTHPGIGTFISAEDRAGVVKGNLPPRLHIIVDPIREQWLAHTRNDCRICQLGLFPGTSGGDPQQNIAAGNDSGKPPAAFPFELEPFINVLSSAGVKLKFNVRGRKLKKLRVWAVLPEKQQTTLNE